MRKFKLLIILIQIVLISVFAIPAKAALVGDVTKATLSLSPQTGNYSANESFKVNIYVNTGGQNINTVAAYLKYDKNYFQALSIDTTGSAFTIEAENVIDSPNGKIKITRAIPTPGINSTNSFVAAVNFKALSNNTSAVDNVTFDFTPGDPTKSAVFVDDGRGTYILSGVYNGKYTVGSGGPITYPDGSLLKASNSEKVYLIENNQKRWIPTGDIFTSNGYSWANVIVVDSAIIAGYADGPNVLASASQSIPEGAIIRAVGDIDVYIVKYVGAKKFKRLILSPSVFNSYQHLKWSDIKNIDKSVIDLFTTSELVRAVGDPKVYKLYPSGDTGEKRWIKTAGTFNNMGFDWDAIYEINQVDRDSYIEGVVIE